MMDGEVLFDKNWPHLLSTGAGALREDLEPTDDQLNKAEKQLRAAIDKEMERSKVADILPLLKATIKTAFHEPEEIEKAAEQGASNSTSSPPPPNNASVWRLSACSAGRRCGSAWRAQEMTEYGKVRRRRATLLGVRRWLCTHHRPTRLVSYSTLRAICNAPRTQFLQKYASPFELY